MQQKIINFFRDDLWQKDTLTLDTPLYKHVLIKILKITILSTQAFINNHCSLRASALTLYTLLSIVPIIAMLFGIAKGFGFETMLESYLLDRVSNNDTLILKLIDMAKKMLASTQGGIVAGFGIAVLFWTVIKVISNIEESLNHIWGIKKSRPFGRKVSDYLSLMLFAPILIIAANSINLMVQITLTKMISAMALPGTILALQLLSYLPLVILWGLFSFIFIFIPNTQVNYISGGFAGAITGSIYYFAQFLYINLQIGVNSYNTIYGSFAALPLFLLWLQIAWGIVLFGAELCYFHQNINHHQFKLNYNNLNFNSKKIISLQLMKTIMQRFSDLKQTAYSVENLSIKLQLPINIVESHLDNLITCNLLTCHHLDSNTKYYQPAYDSQLITNDFIIDALENNGETLTLTLNS